MKRYIAISVLLLAVIPALSQNLDPTVSVSRDYKGKLKEADKPEFTMFVPDSVTHFDIAYDYSVFKTQYKGAYEFNPYLLDLKPAPDAYSGKKFFLRAGAGYSLHPTFDLVWSPVVAKNGLSFNVFADHNSYFGQYRALYGHDAFTGYDMRSRAGFDGRKDWNSCFFGFGIKYDGTHVQDCRGLNGGELYFRVASKPKTESCFVYDFKIGGNYAIDDLSKNPYETKDKVNEFGFLLDGTIGKMFANKSGVLLDVNADYATYKGGMEHYAANIGIVPKYVITGERFNVQLGVNLSVLMSTESKSQENNRTRGQYVYPAVKADFALVKDYLDVYLEALGGNDINRYSKIVASNHRYASYFSEDFFKESGRFIENSFDRVDTKVGARGNIGRKFSYDLYGGYVQHAYAPVFGVQEYAGLLMPALYFESFSSAFAALKLGYQTADIDINAGFKYTRSNLYSHNLPGFEPAPIVADLGFTYNWNRRIFAGVSAKYQSKRSSRYYSLGELCDINMPYYVDLGINLEYRFTRKLSFWLEGSNLLNMEIQKIPMFAEQGIWGTAGITFSL